VQCREKPDETGARLVTPPRKWLLLLSCQTDVFESPAIIATRLLHLHPYKIAVVHEIHDTNRETRVNFAHRYFTGGGGSTLKKETAHSFSLPMRFGFVYGDTQNLRRTGSILHKMP